MSRRLPTSPLAGIFFLLVAGAALAPFLAAPAAAFGERTYESNTVISGTSHLNVYSGQSVAQSFLASASYRLLNLTLRLRNAGDTTDALNVTIRPDVGDVPSNTVLAWSPIVVGNNNLGNYNIPFASSASVANGVRYWIVATSGSLLANAYEWHHSNQDAYPNGRARINLNVGGGWVDPASPTDMYFVAYGRETNANLSTRILATQAEANPDDAVTFRVYLNNTGTGASSAAWLNDTQLSGFTYVSDDAGSVGATTPWPSYTFLDVANGPRSFDLMARVNIGTDPGTVLAKSLTLSFRDDTGAVRTAPTSTASILVGQQTKQLYLGPVVVGSSRQLNPALPTGGPASQSNETFRRDGSPHDFDLDPVLARPFQAAGLNVTLFLDSDSHDVRNLDINLTFADWNGVTLSPVASVQKRITTNAFNDYQPFAFAFPAIDHSFPAGGRIRLTIRNMGSSGADAVLAMNSTFALSRLDLDTTTYIRVDLIDLRDARASATVWSPKDALVIQANVSDPFGSPEITGAQITLTAPSGSVVVNSTAMSLVATDPANPPAWKLFMFPYAPPLSEGLYRIRVTAMEANGVQDIAEATALVRAPRFSLVKTSTQSNVRSGDKFTYDIWFNNSGPGLVGRASINDSLPNELTFLSSSDPGAMTGSYNWTWAGLGVGNHRLSIDVQVKSALPPIAYARNVAFLSYTDEKGFPWPTQAAFVDVAYRGPVITLSTTSVKSVLHSNESIVYQITMQNTGDPAQTLWVNDTMPTGLTYAADTAASLGGTRIVSGNVVYFRFGNMPDLTTWSFTMTATAAPDLVRGSTLTNAVALNYTNSNGFLLPPRAASWTVAVTRPSVLSASIAIARIHANPSDTVSAVVSFSNVGNEAARDIWVNLTLDPALWFLNASLAARVSGNEVSFTLSNVPIGPETINLNASMSASVSDHDFLTVNGTVTYTDGYRNLLPSVPIAVDGVEASVPRIILSVTPGEATVEAAALVFYNVYQVNAGSGLAGDVWLSLPLPAGFVYVSDTSDGTRTVAGSTNTWHWSNVGPGTKSFSLQLRAKPSVLNGTRANLTFHTDYTDANGNFRPGVTAYALANFIAPRVDLVLSSDRSDIRPGETIEFTLTIRNLGGSTAHNLWLTQAIDPRFTFVSYTSRVRASGTTILNWSFVDLQPDQTETVLVVVRIPDGTPARTLIPTVFEANYTNSAETVVGYSRSDVVTVNIVSDALPVAWFGLLGVPVAAFAVFLFLRRIRVNIEEVFLVYRDGVLLYHLSRSLSADKDEDVLSGMLTAVQEFVRDAFAYGEHRELHQLDFGEYRIMIERGKNLYLAVVYSGKGSSSVRRRVRSVLDQVETAYGAVLENWDGDMDRVVGARDLIREYLLKPNGRGLRGRPGLS